MGDMPQHPQARLWPSELVTIGLLFALTGGSFRAFYRWLAREFGVLFGPLPDRTRLQRLLQSHPDWCACFLADPTFSTVIDSYGIELIHPIREGRSPCQIGQKGKSNWRWMVGGKLGVLLNHLGLVVGWACDTAMSMMGRRFKSWSPARRMRWSCSADTGFDKKDWHPTNLKRCKRGEWNTRMLLETMLSMLTTVCHFKKVAHRVWSYFESRLGYTMALFSILVQWHGLQPDDEGFVYLSIAEFSLQTRTIGY
jgi:hypothetical protein